MEEELQSDPTSGGPPEVLNIHIYRPGCRSVLEIGLLAVVVVPFIVLGVAFFYPSFNARSEWGVIVGFEVATVFLFALVALVASISDAFGGRHTEKRRKILTALDHKSATDEFELYVSLLAKKRSRKIPIEARNTALDCPPPAVFLSSREQQSWPMPCPSNIPFEPIPLGRDPHRTASLLNEFVGLDMEGTSDFLGPLKRIRNWRRNLPATTRKLIGLTPALLFYASMGLTGRMSLVVLLLFSAVLLGSFMAVYYRTEFSTPAGWLFPGLIATKTKGKTRVLRRCHGSLWYDALEKVLWVPSENGQFVKLKCEPQDGLIAIWAWLNTAEPPDHIHLDDIA